MNRRGFLGAVVMAIGGLVFGRSVLAPLPDQASEVTWRFISAEGLHFATCNNKTLYFHQSGTWDLSSNSFALMERSESASSVDAVDPVEGIVVGGPRA